MNILYLHGEYESVSSNCYVTGAPLYFSLPHFLYGDQLLLDGVEGMNPNKKEHILDFDVQMVSF